MDASGYREKAPQSVQEEDMRKLTALLEQLEVISEAEKKLDANWVCVTCVEDALIVPKLVPTFFLFAKSSAMFLIAQVYNWWFRWKPHFCSV